MNTLKLVCACTLLALLQGCAAAVVAGGASAVTSANDRRTLGAQIDDAAEQLALTYGPGHGHAGHAQFALNVVQDV